MSNFSKTLGKIKSSTFNKVKVTASEMAKTRGTILPTGKYVAQLVDVTEEVSKNGNPYISWQLKIKGGEFDGRKVFKRSMLATQENIEYFLTDLAQLGYEVAELESTGEVAKILKKLKKDKPAVHIFASNKEDNLNIYFNGIAEDDAESDGGEAEEEEDEEKDEDEEEEEEESEEEEEESEDEDSEEDEDEEKEEDEDEESEDEDSEEEEEEEEEEEGVELEAGMKVQYKVKGKTVHGKIVKLNAKKGTVTVRDLKTKATTDISPDKLLVED